MARERERVNGNVSKLLPMGVWTISKLKRIVIGSHPIAGVYSITPNPTSSTNTSNLEIRCTSRTASSLQTAVDILRLLRTYMSQFLSSTPSSAMGRHLDMTATMQCITGLMGACRALLYDDQYDGGGLFHTDSEGHVTGFSSFSFILKQARSRQDGDQFFEDAVWVSTHDNGLSILPLIPVNGCQEMTDFGDVMGALKSVVEMCDPVCTLINSHNWMAEDSQHQLTQQIPITSPTDESPLESFVKLHKNLSQISENVLGVLDNFSREIGDMISHGFGDIKHALVRIIEGPRDENGFLKVLPSSGGEGEYDAVVCGSRCVLVSISRDLD